MNHLIIYHANCRDGFTAAWVAHTYFKHRGQEVRLYPAYYGSEPPDVVGRDVYVLDFSYPREDVLDMIDKARYFRLLDHHQTVEEALRGLAEPEVLVDTRRSGARLAWDHFYPLDPSAFSYGSQLVNYVQDRDLWRWELPHSEEINAAIGSCEMTLENWDDLASQLASGAGTRDLIYEGSIVLRVQNQQADRAANLSRVARIGDDEVPVVNATAFISETAHAMLQHYPDHPYVAVWYATRSKGYAYSLRSRPGFDVSEVAKRYGGGGHPQASGFRSDTLVHRVA